MSLLNYYYDKVKKLFKNKKNDKIDNLIDDYLDKINSRYNDEFILSDSDDEYEEVKFKTDDYILSDYEKDLETAINLSMKKKIDNQCIICCDNNINVAFIPCGHFACCLYCAKKCKNQCPICRKNYKSLQKIYTI